MVDGGQEVATEVEEVVELAVAGEEPLGMPRRLEPLHLPFASPRRLVRDLGPIVEVTALPMFDPGQDLPLGRTIAPEFIGDDHTGHVPQPLQQLLEKRLAAFALRRLCTRMSSTAPCWSTARRR